MNSVWVALRYTRPLYRRREGACQFFDFFNIRPLRGGAGRGSTRRCRCELDVRFFSRARSELGAPSVAVRGGIQLRGVAASSMSAFFFSRARSELGAPPWRCGAGFNSEMSLRARCDFLGPRAPNAWG